MNSKKYLQGMYVVTALVLRFSHIPMLEQNTARMKAERSLLIQGFLIGLFLILSTYTFCFGDGVLGPLGEWGRMVGIYWTLMNNAINPGIYMTFNYKLRRHMLKVALW